MRTYVGFFVLLVGCSTAASERPDGASPLPVDGASVRGDGRAPNPRVDAGPVEPAARVDNPFAGATFYVSPAYAANVDASIARAPSHADRLRALRTQPTAVWLDRIAAIEGGGEAMGVAEHLDAALAQATPGGGPVLVVFVIYDLPNRDCAALASNGELRLENDGARRYREEYIDRIAAVLASREEYRSLRVVTILEPDSLPNLVTNLDGFETCRTAASAYREGVAYAIRTLAALEHVYVYLDIAHSGWLGWEHPANAARVYREVLTLAGGEDLVRGFATNVSNYSPTVETFDPFADLNANRSMIEGFYEWNRVIDEHRFVAAMRAHFPNHGFLIDTGRNGWPSRGANQPREARTHRGNWCNQTGAGIGERPRADPAPGIDAYFWIKPPGESDGTSDESATGPNDEGKRFDPMCGQAPVVRPYSRGVAIPTNALEGAPHAGRWFHDQLLMLVDNATPPL